MLAGAGGVPAGREAGEWIDGNVPRGATFMTIGPSMANLVQFYGRREAYGLSVSPNPLNRNPSYEPIVNPDQALRDRRHPVRGVGHVLGVAGARLLGPSARLRRALRRPRRPRRDAPGTNARRAHGAQAGDRGLRGAAVRIRRATLLVLATTAALAGTAPAEAAPPAATPIRHFIVLMQENHSFDNYFGTYPGADGIPHGTCMPIRPSRRPGRACVPSGSGTARGRTCRTTRPRTAPRPRAAT